ncbi:MAG TPA: carboxylesterase family protein, partial [Ilumatobacteraceae bacterium]|nr:carboxylesterase family protein [Ilumatobacteraceae bacterium]
GIPYATAERFEQPVAVASLGAASDTVFDATTYRALCPQLLGGMERLLGGSRLPASEECHHLNVFTPGCDDQRRPVLVWIHGGAFVTGSGATPWYHGASLAALGDVVVVTINYRLGSFGFAGRTNLGIADQVAALTWVRDAIGAFGGDQDNVTVFGESAGGASVIALLAAPSARDLFHGAVAMSPSLAQLRSTTRADRATGELVAAAGVQSIDDLRDRPVDDLLAAQAAVLADPTRALTAFAPTSHGDLLPGDILSAAGADPRPLVIGTTRDEMHLFNAFDPANWALDEAGLRTAFERRFPGRAELAISEYRSLRPDHTPGQLVSAMQTDEMLRVPVRRLTEARVASGNATWMYWFAWPSSAFGGILGACHAVDIPFVFHNLDRPGVQVFTGDGDDRLRVADEVAGAVLRFASDGKPGWDPYELGDRTTRRFATETETVLDPEPSLRELWATSP